MKNPFEKGTDLPGILFQHELVDPTSPHEHLEFIAAVCNQAGATLGGEHGDSLFAAMSIQEVEDLKSLTQKYLEADPADRSPITKEASDLIGEIWERV